MDAARTSSCWWHAGVDKRHITRVLQLVGTSQGVRQFLRIEGSVLYEFSESVGGRSVQAFPTRPAVDSTCYIQGRSFLILYKQMEREPKEKYGRAK